MERTALQKMKEAFSSLGLGMRASGCEDHRFFSAYELASLKLQLQVGNQIARDVAVKNGAKLHPRVAAIQAKVK